MSNNLAKCYPQRSESANGTLKTMKSMFLCLALLIPDILATLQCMPKAFYRHCRKYLIWHFFHMQILNSMAEYQDRTNTRSRPGQIWIFLVCWQFQKVD